MNNQDISRKMIIRCMLFVSVVCTILFIGCAPTTNCYTARTLDKSEKAMTPGLDYIAFMDEKGEVEFNKTGFVPSLGIVFGLPYRMEAGIRGYYPYTLESAFRWQVNPKSFACFDFSVNCHFGTLKLTHFPYSKFGLTLGKNIKGFQPFISYYQYAYYGDTIFEIDGDFFQPYNVVCFGVGIPYRIGLIIPEVNCVFSNEYPKNTLYFFSIGMRNLLKKNKQ